MPLSFFPSSLLPPHMKKRGREREGRAPKDEFFFILILLISAQPMIPALIICIKGWAEEEETTAEAAKRDKKSNISGRGEGKMKR